MRALNEGRMTSLVLLVIASGLLSWTYGQSYADLGGAFSPMFFPRIILWLWLGLALLHLLPEAAALIFTVESIAVLIFGTMLGGGPGALPGIGSTVALAMILPRRSALRGRWKLLRERPET